MWEESPIGDWTLEVINDGRQRVDLKDWSVSFYGTKDHPQPEKLRENVNTNVPMVNVNPDNTAPIGNSKEVDLNQVPNEPIQNSADVSQPHHGAKNLDVEQQQSSPMNQELHLEHCLEASDVNWCTKCEAGYLFLNGRCVEACPNEGYYVGQENDQNACIQCYYTCKTCTGPNDYEVRKKIKSESPAQLGSEESKEFTAQFGFAKLQNTV